MLMKVFKTILVLSLLLLASVILNIFLLVDRNSLPKEVGTVHKSEVQQPGSAITRS